MEEVQCGICYESDPEETGELDCCAHIFCFACISQWAGIESRCPMCKLRFSTKVVHEDPTFQTWIEGLHCQHCGSGENEDRLLLCDRCDTAWHTYCVGLDAVPEGEWFCPRCRPAAEEGGRRRRLRRLRDDSPTAVVDVVAEEEGRRVRRRGSASSRRRRSSAAALVDEDDNEEESEASDDSFIVPDDEEEVAESSGSEEEELDLESGSDEEGLAARARRLASSAGSRRLRRLRRGSRGAPEPPARAASGRPSRSSAGAAHDANATRPRSGRRQSTVIDEDFDEDEDLPLAVRLARAQRRPGPSRADAHVTPPAARSNALVRRISDRWQDLRDGRVSFEDLRGGSPAAVVDLLTPPRVPSAAAASPRSPPGSARAVPASLRGEDAGGAPGASSFESRLRQEISGARVRGSRLVPGADPARTVAASRAAGRPLGRSPYFAGPPADAAAASASGGRWRERVTGSGAPTEASAGPAPSTSGRHVNRGGDRSPPPRRDRGATSASSPAWRQRIPDRAAPSPPTAHQSRRSSSSRAGGSPAPRTPSGLGRAIKAALLPHYVHGRLTDGEYREVCRRASRTLRALRWDEAGAEQGHRLEVARAVGAAVSEVRGRVR